MSEKLTIARAAETPALDVFGVRVQVLSATEDCSIARVICPPGCGAPMHRHIETECFVAVRGEITVLSDNDPVILAVGDTATVAPWQNHTFRNDTAEEVEFLTIGTPGEHAKFFADAHALAESGNFNPATAAEVCARHNIELVG